VPTAAVIDSQTVRAADTVPTASSGYDGGKKLKGRKRHVAVDTGGLLLVVVVTTASLQDREGAFGITAALGEACSTITWWGPTPGTQAGSSVTHARSGTWRWLSSSAPTRPRAWSCTRRRWVVERSLAWLTTFRRLVRDDETLPATHQAMIWTAATWQLSNRLTR
jgi:transposase